MTRPTPNDPTPSDPTVSKPTLSNPAMRQPTMRHPAVRHSAVRHPAARHPAILLLTAALALAPAARAEVAETETEHHELRLEQPLDARLRIDLLNGSIAVVPGAGDTVRAVVTIRRTADDEGRLETARREIRLEIAQTEGTSSFVMRTPWNRRESCAGAASGGARCDFPGWDRLGYEVAYDLRVEVPRSVALELETVWGDIDVRGIEGPFEVGSVFGEVRLKGLASAGSASNVNGPLWAAFAHAPASESEFQTVNGPLEVRLPRSADADLSFQTLNGEVTTDLPVRSMPRPVGVAERKGGRFVYRSAAGAWVRLGDGGPTFTFETVNGDITLLAAEEDNS